MAGGPLGGQCGLALILVEGHDPGKNIVQLVQFRAPGLGKELGHGLVGLE